MGEHSDWAGGLTTSKSSIDGCCVVYTTQCGISCVVSDDLEQRPRLTVTHRQGDGEEGHGAERPLVFECAVSSLDELLASATDSSNYYAYVCGGVHETLRYLSWRCDVEPGSVLLHGLRLADLHSNMPERRGFSSSASVTVLAVKAVLTNVARGAESKLAHVATEALTTVGVCMELAWWGERLTGSLCGQMDQCVACSSHGFQLMTFTRSRSELCEGLALGEIGEAMNARASEVSVSHIPHPTSFYFVVADLRVGKDTRCILKCLSDAVTAEDEACPIPGDGEGGGACPPTHHPDPHLQSHERSTVLGTLLESLPAMTLDRMDEAARLIESVLAVNPTNSPARFLREENALLMQVASLCIRLGSEEGLGLVMSYCQVRFDACLQHLCPELRSPKLHSLLSDPRIRALSLGGKGVGSQGDGSVQFLCGTREQQQQLHDLLASDEFACIPFTFEL